PVFFSRAPPPPALYPLSLHDALPIFAVPDLPRTRSGKIMRRLLAQLVHAERDRRRGVTPEPLGDVTSLQNPDAVDTVIAVLAALDRKSTRLNSSHVSISYAVFCLKNK